MKVSKVVNSLSVNTAVVISSCKAQSMSAQLQQNVAALQKEGRVLIGVGFGLFLCLLTSGKVEAANFSKTKVVDYNTPIPSGTGNFNALSTPALDKGSVAFSGSGDSQSSTYTNTGIYTNIGGVLNVVVDYKTLVPGGTGNFQHLGEYWIENGRVAFAGSQDRGGPLFEQGIYTNLGGSLNVVASGIGVLKSPVLNNGSVAFLEAPEFRSFFPGQQAIYTNVGGTLNTVVDRTNFAFLGRPSLDNGSVAFIGSSSYMVTPDRPGVYTKVDASLKAIADTNTPIPGGAGNFNNFGEVSLSNGSVAFVGFGSGQQQGIYTNLGGSLNVVADTNTPIPNRTGNFTSFSSTLSLNKGNIAFVGTGTSSQGIYTPLVGCSRK